jgi:hypothetical protein
MSPPLLKTFAPVPLRLKVPPMVLVPLPFTVMVKAVAVGTVNVVPLPMFRLLVTVTFPTVVAEAAPLRVRFPPMAAPKFGSVFTPLPERVRLL